MRAPARYQPADVARLLGLFPPTDEQAAVIQAPLEPAVVIAGAGSGKTETMAARVVWLVANELVEPDRILGLTFTRKAAGELQHRIRARLKSLNRALGRSSEAGEPTVLTYAAYSGRLVEEHGIVLGCESGSRLLTEAARWQVADAVVRRYDGMFSVEPGVVATVTERLLNLSGQLADHLAEPEQVRRLAARLREELAPLPAKPGARTRNRPENVEKLLESLTKRLDLLPLVELFDERKRAEGLLDFADQMVLASRLAAMPAVATVERSRYDVVLLDEYQDSGHAQIQMLSALFGDGRAVTAVGDPLQSIYSWRGASSANIGKFSERFRTRSGKPAPVYSLMTSWRNDRRILSVANRVAEQLRGPGGLPLTARPDAPAGRVLARYSESVADEAGWLARQLRAEWDARLDWTSGQRTLAVLVRKRSGIALIAQALRDAGLPVEVVDIGGLLTLPEIADVRAVLQVLADHNAGGSLARLLTGARWRIGPADLVALHQRARVLARLTGLAMSGASDPAASDPAASDPAASGAAASGRAAQPDDDERIEPSLVEALDDLGEASQYSAEGYRRLAECAAMLRGLRRRLELPLPDLVAEVERALGLDVEVASRPGAEHAGRANLDRFIDEAARFASDRAAAGVSAFLGYLRAAEEEEYGLKPATLEVLPDRVQVLTVHGAKGLEWDVVAVAGLVADGFPDIAKNHDWASTPALLPSPLRGDAADLPVLDFAGCQHHGDSEARIADHRTRLKQRHLDEERRLAYVAFTRARKALYACGAAWGAGSKPRPASVFLEELRESDAVEVDGWWQVADGEQNPMSGVELGQRWPADPLAGRRPLIERGASRVLAAMNHLRAFDAPSEASQLAASQRSPLAKLWERDVDLLLAERAAAAELGVIEVAVPDQLSVSDVVTLAADPGELARRLRRPLPQRPAKQARRGTAFHQWLEQRWAAESLLDIDDLPGAVDELADAGELEALKAAFERSSWADRTPIAVEVGFEMSFGARVVRGRMDAVFCDPDGRYTVVDWKTGRPPTGADAEAKAVQLALYRLAWAAIRGIPDSELGSVGAAFYYVGADRTVAPANLLDAGQLRELINGGL
ncbi:MAG TPA: ATP-dependent DNA helicase [Jatrophihabitans sp.]